MDGNGRRSMILKDLDTVQLPEDQTYQSRLRAAIYNGVTEQDVADVVKCIVAKAKSGDKVAIAQFFEFVVGSKAQRVTINNSFRSVEEAAKIAKTAKTRIRT